MSTVQELIVATSQQQLLGMNGIFLGIYLQYAAGAGGDLIGSPNTEVFSQQNVFLQPLVTHSLDAS